MTASLTDSVATESGARTWWNKPFRMFQTNLREIDATLDVGQVLDFIEDFGADTWLVNAGGIMSFYPTDLPFQTRNPYLAEREGGDMLGDAVAGAHARGVRLIARMDFSKISQRIADEHPEWCFTSPTGERQEYSGLVSVCPSGQYYRERTLEILDEVLDRYPVDGFFFNWFGFNEVDYSKVYRGVCHCSACATAFTERTGRSELPTGPQSPGYDEWQLFSAAQVDDVTDRIRSHIAARRPDAGLILGKKADIIFHEANNAVGRPLWPIATEQSVSAIKAARPEVPVLVNSVSFVDMPYRLTAEQPEMFGQYLIQTIARGGNPSTYIMGTPGDIPYSNLPVAAEVTRFHRSHSEIYDGLLPAAQIGLVRPAAIGRDSDRKISSRSEFEGVSLALVERHVPYDVLDERDLPAIELARYDVVVLPEVDDLAPEAVAALERWVSAGGYLVTLGRAGFDSAGLAQLAGAPALRVLAERSTPTELRSRYVARSFSTSAGSSGLTEPAVPIHGLLCTMEWAAGAERTDLELGAATFGPPEKAWGNTPNGEPGFARAAVGAGSITVVPSTIGRVYRELGLTVARDYLVDRVLRGTGWQPRLELTLPSQVAAFVGRSAAGTVVHLDNLSGVRAASVDAHLPVSGGSLVHHGSLRSARALVSGTSLDIHREGDTTRIELPPIEQFEVLLLED